jgi:hypothetical protein
VDTQGLALKAKVHAANVFDRDGIKPLMELVGAGSRAIRICGSMPATTLRAGTRPRRHWL